MRRDSKLVCEEYLDYVRTKPCVGCGKMNVDAHHLKAVGWRESKRMDFTAVSLCRACHQEFHKKGRVSFESAHDVDLYEEALFITVEFFVDRTTAKIERGKV